MVCVVHCAAVSELQCTARLYRNSSALRGCIGTSMDHELKGHFRAWSLCDTIHWRTDTNDFKSNFTISNHKAKEKRDPERVGGAPLRSTSIAVGVAEALYPGSVKQHCRVWQPYIPFPVYCHPKAKRSKIVLSVSQHV